MVACSPTDSWGLRSSPNTLFWLTGVQGATPVFANKLSYVHFTWLCGACARARRPDSGAGDLKERLARDAELQRALAVSQRVGRLLLKAEAGELALVDELAAELLQNESRWAPAALTAATLLAPGCEWHCRASTPGE